VRIKRATALVGSLALLGCMVGAVIYLSYRADQIKRERARAMHQAAKADADEITRESDRYWNRKFTSSPTQER
jgi:hypothetical protein